MAEAISAFLVECLGKPYNDHAPPEKATQASITVYGDGSRDVGCRFLNNGMCKAAGLVFSFAKDSSCLHLVPDHAPAQNSL